MKSHSNNHFAPAIVMQLGCNGSIAQAVRHGVTRPWFVRPMGLTGGLLS
jgi:hypothetical protein